MTVQRSIEEQLALIRWAAHRDGETELADLAGEAIAAGITLRNLPEGTSTADALIALVNVGILCRQVDQLRMAIWERRQGVTA